MATVFTWIEYGWYSSRGIATTPSYKTFVYFSRTYSCGHCAWN